MISPEVKSKIDSMYLFRDYRLGEAEKDGIKYAVIKGITEASKHNVLVQAVWFNPAGDYDYSKEILGFALQLNNALMQIRMDSAELRNYPRIFIKFDFEIYYKKNVSNGAEELKVLIKKHDNTNPLVAITLKTGVGASVIINKRLQGMISNRFENGKLLPTHLQFILNSLLDVTVSLLTYNNNTVRFKRMFSEMITSIFKQVGRPVKITPKVLFEESVDIIKKLLYFTNNIIINPNKIVITDRFGIITITPDGYTIFRGIQGTIVSGDKSIPITNGSGVPGAVLYKMF